MTLSRSVVLTSEPPFVPHMVPRPQSANQEGFNLQRRRCAPGQSVYLLMSDLWADVIGERVTPETLCRINEISMNPFSGSGPTSKYALMARDRQDCRVLQQLLEDSNESERGVIFESLFSQLGDLVFDQSANYVIQKLCEVATIEQQTRLLMFFLNNMKTVVAHPNGCRVLQKFLETTESDNVMSIFRALRETLVDLCKSLNGNHIVQRFVELLPDQVDDIIEVMRPHVIDLAIDNCGCRVVQRIFEKISIERLEPLVQEVLAAAVILATNQYGNYVVQSILRSGRPRDVSELIRVFTGHFYDFSMHKYASNVIEKCIRGATPAQREPIFDEVIGSGANGDGSRIVKMATNQFGNYVVQRIIEFGVERQRDAIYAVVYDAYDDLYNVTYAKHVYTRLSDLGYEF